MDAIPGPDHLDGPAGALDAEIRRYSDAVLMRDASKTDYLVTPLAAGVIASCVLAAGAEQIPDGNYRAAWPEYQRLARDVLTLCEESHDDRWTTEAALYGVVFKFVEFTWSPLFLWIPDSYVVAMTGIKIDDPPAASFQTVVRWLRDTPDRSLIEYMFVVGYATVLCDVRRGEHPLFARAARPLRVELARRLRAAGLTSWPRIVRAATAQWDLPTLQRLAFDIATSYSTIFDVILPAQWKDDDGPVGQDEWGIGPAPAQPASVAPAEGASDADAEAIVRHSERIRALESELGRLVEKSQRLEQARLVTAERHAGAESYAAALKRQLAEATERNKGLEWELVVLKREHERLKEDVAVEEALAPGAPGPPSDALEGRRVLLFTGQAVAATREAMRQSFFEYGAGQVDCYWTEKSRGPESYPGDAIVVIDVTFMSHSDSGAIEDRARRSEAWCMLCRRGAALIAREAATRFRARRGSKGQAEGRG